MELKNAQNFTVTVQVYSVQKIHNWEGWTNLTSKSDCGLVSEERSLLEPWKAACVTWVNTKLCVVSYADPGPLGNFMLPCKKKKKNNQIWPWVEPGSFLDAAPSLRDGEAQSTSCRDTDRGGCALWALGQPSKALPAHCQPDLQDFLGVRTGSLHSADSPSHSIHCGAGGAN